MKIIECVPNFSEGRDLGVIKQITDAIESVQGVELLDVDPGESTNRTVVTFVGEPEPVKEAAFRAVQKASELIDMASHHGEHARFGATDVCPFVPVAGVTMEECAEIAGQVGKRIGEELAIPVFLYEHAARSPGRRNLADVRSGEYEGLETKLSKAEWKPDFGPAAFNRKSGATAVGAREFLIAYNINLNTTDRRYANEIAYELRERGRWKRTGNTHPFYYKGEVVNFEEGKFPDGNSDFVADSFDQLAAYYEENYGSDLAERLRRLGLDPENLTGRPVYKDGLFTHLKGIGWVVDDYQCAQISLNLTNYNITPPHRVLEAARELAAERGIVITGSEAVGVVPFEAMRQAGHYYLQRMQKSTGIPARDIIVTAVQAMGLNDVAAFDIDKKVIGMPAADGPLASLDVAGFVDEVSRDTPAPGGGSIAALAGALGSALASMVVNLSIGKGEYDANYRELCQLAEKAQSIKDELVRAIDADTAAFNEVLDAIRMAKDTADQIAQRSKAIQAGYKSAARVPLKTAELCREVLDLCQAAADIGNRAVMSDAGVGALMAYAGVQGAIHNVRINLPQTKDEAFIKEMNSTLGSLLSQSREICAAIQQQVESCF
ncbi:MAG: glutamate formimidoyltransferase [Xanthomonadales bacterium]|nr:glutamate formimidoyltransferase [Gammaproteobacteria bacterium]NND55977.1 glutamate formimidoyltransferase [Xanthomonadales bacterium]NNK51531.1 glutamate formimidoyltransferase [Xanthomonadales bacterium]